MPIIYEAFRLVLLVVVAVGVLWAIIAVGVIAYYGMRGIWNVAKRWFE